jgi:AcrR family transcriptional regulator
MAKASNLRARVRAEMIDEIKRTARQHLAASGAADLSLRAVARELGVVSSALYRYFGSRDELLTALIIDAYNDLGDAADGAEAAVERADLPGRYAAVCHAVRRWALDHPHEYALTFGTPVPGYEAPDDTLGPGSRVSRLLLRILLDGVGAGVVRHQPGDWLAAPVQAEMIAIAGRLSASPGTNTSAGRLSASPGTSTSAGRLSASPGTSTSAGRAAPGIPPTVLARGLIAWTQLFGAVSFEVFGRIEQIIGDKDAWFDHEVLAMTRLVGLRP